MALLRFKRRDADQLSKGDVDRSYDIEVHKMMGRLQWAALAGCGLIVLYSFQFYKSGFFFSIVSTGVVIAGAFAFVGFLLGFVFCIPRTAKQSDAIAASSSEPQGGPDDDHGTAKSIALAKSNVETNTNLVDISDWLTKILVGVGLVELSRIPTGLKMLATYLGRGLRGGDATSYTQSSEAFALSIIIFFFGAGFLIGYLWTRLYYQNALQGFELQRTYTALVRARVELADKDVKLATKDKFWSDATDEAKDVERLIAENRIDEALQLVDGAIKTNPDNALILLLKGRILKRKAQTGGLPGNRQLLRDALRCATQAAELMPDRGGPRYNMACYQALLGFNRTDILDNLKRAVDLNPKLKAEAPSDEDLKTFWEDEDFKGLIKGNPAG